MSWGKITGDDVPEEIINEIFAQFCVGKMDAVEEDKKVHDRCGSL